MAKEVYDLRAKPRSSQLKDIYLRHGINLTRYSNHQARKLLDILDTANIQIRGIVYKTKGVETKEHYRMVASEIKRVTKDLIEKLDRQLELDFKDLAEEESRFVENAMRKVGVTADFNLPAPAKIWSAASFGSYTNTVSRMYPNRQQGVTFEQYINKFGNDVFNTWDNQVRAGYMFGLTAKQIARNVLGSMNTENMEVGQIQKLRKSLEMNTRTMVSHLAETARTETYRKNSSLFSGYRYIGTLDSRTCLVCGELDGKAFEGSKQPEEPHLPQHFSCRCLWLPEIKGMEGFDDDDTRASVDGPVSANMTYEEWLEKQPPEVQKDILGFSRYALYKDGMPITSFVADGQKLNLQDLAKKEGIDLSSKT
jgi:SPP1 gp7 family putative phage head morphogenesis protein